MEAQRFQQTIAHFDRENAQDPHQEEDGGQTYPKELLYAKRMSAVLLEFNPTASEALQLAARCQHIKRWELPRSSFPDGRKGYLLWRSKLKEMHAKTAAEILQWIGYDDDVVQQVSKLLKKSGLKTDPEVQVLEDVACIVFLSYYFQEFSQKHDAEKLREILQKTLKKMSDEGIAYAKRLDNAEVFLQYLA